MVTPCASVVVLAQKEAQKPERKIAVKLKYLKYAGWLGVILTAVTLSWHNHPHFLTFFHSPWGTIPFLLGDCTELKAFRTATEHLGQEIIRSPRLGRNLLWWNAINKGTYVKNTGVTHSTLQIKPVEPVDDNSLYFNVTLDPATGQPTPSCDTNYEDLNMGFIERTFGPKRRRFRGPVLCRENFVFQHNIDGFLDGYVDEMGRFTSRVWEFSLRADYMNFGDIFIDYAKFYGPNALAGIATPPYQELTQDMLDDGATDLINVGAGVPDNQGYVMNGGEGPMFTLYIDMRMSARILKNNYERRQDARWAFPNELWKAVGASRIVGNFRHVVTDIAPRFNFTGGKLVGVSPFKDVTTVSGNGEMLTDAYKNAPYEAAQAIIPDAMTAEIITPTNWKFPNTENYMGDWDFIIGGFRVCNPPEYDPQGNKGRHFSAIEYAPRPDRPYTAKSWIYKRCSFLAHSVDSVFCS